MIESLTASVPHNQVVNSVCFNGFIYDIKVI